MSLRLARMLCLAFLPLGPATHAVSGESPSAFQQSGSERQVLRFNDLAASQGLAPPPDHAGFAVNRMLLRGFANESTLRNGHRDFGYLGAESDTAQEGVEVFKGPASALYGNGKPGGDVNLLVRQPDGERRRDAQLSIDRYGFHALRADLGGGMGDLARGPPPMAFRVGLGVDAGPGRREFDDFEGYGLSPSIAWQAGPRSRVLIEADFVHLRDQIQPDRVPLAPVIAFPGERTLGEPGDLLKESGRTLRLSVDHAIGAGLRLRQAFFLQRSRFVTEATELDVYGLTDDEVLSDDRRSANRVSVRRRERVRTEVSQTELHAGFHAFGAAHQLLLDLELGRYRLDALGSIAPLAPLDLLSPAYGAQPGSFEMDADQAYRSRSTVLIVQDRLHFGERWQALAGLRAERLQAHSKDRLGDERHEGRSSLLSPRLGLVYTPRPGLSWFASWTQSSRPQLGVATADGQLLPPEEGRQIEGGLQWGRAERGLVGTLSVYRLQRSHLATTDTRNPSFSVAGGRRESRGIELELRGEPARGMQLDLSVEALRARVVKDNDVPSGTALPGVAPWFLSLWLTQQLDEAWTLGAGLVGEGRRRAAMPPNELRLPSYATMDLSLAYRASGWRLQLGLGNVFGRRALVSDGYAVRIVDPRSATLVLSASL